MITELFLKFQLNHFSVKTVKSSKQWCLLGTCSYSPACLFRELVVQMVGHSVSGWRSAVVQDRNAVASLLLFPKIQTVSSVDVQTTKWGKVAVFSGLSHECIPFSTWVHYVFLHECITKILLCDWLYFGVNGLHFIHPSPLRILLRPKGINSI